VAFDRHRPFDGAKRGAAGLGHALAAYAVWTGIGAVGTVILGIVLFHEPANAARLICVGLIVAGILGLKITSPA
jgi:multidrug transporter EmrE-like cation transporter